MALINCKECGKEISASAERCPHCGYKTNYGKSIDGAKTLMVQYVIAVVLLLIGIILVINNLPHLLELHNDWKTDWFYQYNDFSFVSFLKDEHETGALNKLLLGIALVVGSAIDLFVIKGKSDSLVVDTGESEKVQTTKIGSEVAEKETWRCANCGETNDGRVATCQYCGVTKAWSENQKK